MCRLGATMFSECQDEAGGHGESARLLHLLHLLVICACAVSCLSYICSELLTSTFKDSNHLTQIIRNIL